MDNNECVNKPEPETRYLADDTGDLSANHKYLQGQVETLQKSSKMECAKETTIYNLPKQVWLEIYENLDYATFLNMRQASSYFLQLIDHYIGLRVTFNKATTSDPEVFNFFTGVALNDVQFEDAVDQEQFHFDKLLAYPSFLTDVSFTGETNLQLVKDIILNCHCLQLVEMTMDCKILKSEVDLDPDPQGLPSKRPWLTKKNILPGVDIQSPHPPSVSYLRFVECLKLVPGIHSDDNIRSHLILSILRSTRAENYLKKVIFQCELSDQITLKNVLTVTAEVMERHSKLEALFLALLNDEYLLSETEMETYSHYMDLSNSDEDEELNYFKKRIVATGQHLRIKKMGLAMLNLNMQRIWGDFLKTQHHLVHLSLTVTIEQGTFSQEMFNAFSGTLEQLAIRGKFGEPFDFMHVSNCRNLKEICLHNLQDNGGGGIVPKCVNIPHAPDDLESLILFQVVTRTEEIMDALQKLEKLTTLVVFKCGHAAGETGIGLRCLQQILHKRSLQSVLMVQFICGSTQEAEALAGVLYDMAQDAENQAGPLGRRRRLMQQQQVVPANEPENLLDLREIEDGGDELLFAVGGGPGGPVAGPQHAHIGRDYGRNRRRSPSLSPPRSVERPVSRGRHRDPDEVDEALILERDDDSGQGTSPSSRQSVEEARVVEDRGGIEPPLLLSPENFPPLPELDVQDVFNNNLPPIVHVEEIVEGNINNDRLLDDNSSSDESIPEIVIDVNDENNAEAMNMLHNILEQAMVVDPGQPPRNPNLQNHMNLNRLQQQFDENVELILDVGDQELGPVLDLFAAERLAREHNVQVGFILDGVIDIMNEEAVRSKWLCVEDSEGHITYTLKISVEL